ncbi:hypothetical protein AOXY_G3696 [Acipenser oxyrinchus oxyrinchus]|uniref:Uncharacterized protein n=1 Tax=Acipenser oxyrinchus oxyrinchus TaxID=40147 RepID=A0AAD8GFM4_ACIOX|nr:hypothetical protein AOXY_G3696 [Acipenser oxyrinchus oxyrinchus]
MLLAEAHPVLKDWHQWRGVGTPGVPNQRYCLLLFPELATTVSHTADPEDLKRMHSHTRTSPSCGSPAASGPSALQPFKMFVTIFK